MQVNINENAEAIVKKLMESGQFPTVDSVVNSIILTAYRSVLASDATRIRLPDPITDGTAAEPAAELPRQPFQTLAIGTISRRVPEFVEAQ